MESFEYQIDPTKKINLHREVDCVMGILIERYLKHLNGSVADTARQLQVSRTTLHEMIKRLGLDHLKKRRPMTRKGVSNGRKS